VANTGRRMKKSTNMRKHNPASGSGLQASGGEGQYDSAAGFYRLKPEA